MATAASQFCDLFSSLDKTEGPPETPQYEALIIHKVPENVHQINIGHQLKVILDFEDQKQEASAFLGREGGLEEFLSIVYTGEVSFLTEEAKIATALDLLSGGLSAEDLRVWPTWKLQELLEFLYFRIRALERSRRLTLAGSFASSLNKKKLPQSSESSTAKDAARPLSKLLIRSKQQKQQQVSAIPDLFHPQTRKPSWKVINEYGVDQPTVCLSKSTNIIYTFLLVLFTFEM